MRHYETLFIITPELNEDETVPVADKYAEVLTSAGSEMGKIEHWGRRRLAYEVKKFNKGYFVLFEYGADPEAVAEMERQFKIDEQIIRFLTVKKADAFDPEAVVVKAGAESPDEEDDAATEAQDDKDAANDDDHDDNDDDDDDDDDDSGESKES